MSERKPTQRESELVRLMINTVCDGARASETLEDFLRLLPVELVRDLLDNLPTLAGPWRVIDMRRGEATRMERAGWGGEPIAVVKRRAISSWSAFVGNTLIEAPESGEAGSINWPTCDAARAACDARMASDGVLLDAEVTR